MREVRASTVALTGATTFTISCMTPDGSHVVVGSSRELSVFLADGTLVQRVPGLGALDDDASLAATCPDATITLTSLHDGATRSIGPCSPPVRARFTAGGGFLGVVDDRGLRFVRLRDARTFRVVPALADHQLQVIALDDMGHFDAPDALASTLTWRSTRSILGATLEDASSRRAPGLLAELGRP